MKKNLVQLASKPIFRLILGNRSGITSSNPSSNPKISNFEDRTSQTSNLDRTYPNEPRTESGKVSKSKMNICQAQTLSKV